MILIDDYKLTRIHCPNHPNGQKLKYTKHMYALLTNLTYIISMEKSHISVISARCNDTSNIKIDIVREKKRGNQNRNLKSIDA